MTLGNLVFSILQTCPYHPSLLLLNWESMEQVSHIDSMAAFETQTLKEMRQMCVKQLSKKADIAAEDGDEHKSPVLSCMQTENVEASEVVFVEDRLH